MTPDDDRLSDRVDGLLASYGTLMQITGRIEERVGGHDREIKGIRETRKEDVESVMDALVKIDERCEKKVARIEAKIDAQNDARKWTPREKAALIAPTLASLVTAVALVVVG